MFPPFKRSECCRGRRDRVLSRSLLLALTALACASPAAGQLSAGGAYEVRAYAHTLVPPAGFSERLKTGAGAGLEIARVSPRGMAWSVDLSRSDLVDRSSGTIGVWAFTAGAEQRWHRPVSPRWDVQLSVGGSVGASWTMHSDRGARAGPLALVSGGIGMTNGRLGAHLRLQGVAADWKSLAPEATGAGVPVGLRVLGGLSLQL
jgi:hypothetical protein